jgi:hypothetical protein
LIDLTLPWVISLAEKTLFVDIAPIETHNSSIDNVIFGSIAFATDDNWPQSLLTCRSLSISWASSSLARRCLYNKTVIIRLQARPQVQGESPAVAFNAAVEWVAGWLLVELPKGSSQAAAKTEDIAWCNADRGILAPSLKLVTGNV